jgi:FkbM family methyltransferase
MHKKRGSIDVLALALLLASGVVVSYRFLPGASGAMLWLVGRSPDCPLDRARDAQGVLVRHVENTQRLLGEIRKAETDAEGFERYTVPGGGSFWVPKGSGRNLAIILGEAEEQIYGRPGQNGVHRGDIVIDCGAHVGVFTRQALDAGAAKVLAVEPAPPNLKCLRRNFAQEIADGRVVVVEEGVWDKETTLSFVVDLENSAGDHVVEGGGQGTTSIKVTTIDKLAAQLGLPRVDFIKMDIEGAERNALAGAAGVLKAYQPRMAISAYHLPDDPQVLPAVVRKAQPRYTMTCGHCWNLDFKITQQLQFFQ